MPNGSGKPPKIPKEEREQKEKRIKDLEEEKFNLVADIALLKQEDAAEAEVAALEAEFDELDNG